MLEDLLKHIANELRVSLEGEMRALRADSAALVKQNAQLTKRLADMELHNAGMHASLANMVISNNALLKDLDRFVRGTGSVNAGKEADATQPNHSGDATGQNMRQH